MKAINLGTVKLYIRPSCVSTFDTIYGISLLRAKRLNAFLLNHPTRKRFRQDLRYMVTTYKYRGLFMRLFVEKKIRIYVSRRLKRKFLSFTYQRLDHFSISFKRSY